MKTNIKMRVTPEQSKRVQEIVLENGGRWAFGSNEIKIESFQYGLGIEPYTKEIPTNEIRQMKTEEIYENVNLEEVDPDLFIRTNGTCEEEPHAELKRRYDSDDYILMLKCKTALKWGRLYGFNNSEWRMDFNYKLIHKRHKEVLDHWLNGGKIEANLNGYNGLYWEEIVGEFIEAYNEDWDYRIKQDQPQTPTFATKKEPKQDTPDHYDIGIDTFTRMRANATFEEAMGFIRWNIDKYNTRKKGQDVEDYTKIKAYCDEAMWWLENMGGE